MVRAATLTDTMSRYLVERIASTPSIEVRYRSEVVAGRGEGHLEALTLADRDSGATEEVSSSWLFVFIGADADTEWLPAQIARDPRGYVLTGDKVVSAGRWSHNRDPYLLETSVPGVFACGDVRLSPVKRVASAVGEGSMAIALVHQYFQQDRPTS